MPQTVATRVTAEVAEAAEALRAGRLVAFPTETVYGLGADARNAAAVRRLYEVKGRPPAHPVIVHLWAVEQLHAWAAEVPAAAERLARAFWPGPMTLILPRAGHVLDEVTGGQDTVGLRVPAHPVALALLRAFGGGVAAPSANRFGRLSPTRAGHVRSELEGLVELVLEGGPATVGLESTIVNLTGDEPTILRPGHIRPDQIAQVLGRAVALSAQPGTIRAAGTLPSHYAPRTPLRVVPGDELEAEVRRLRQPVAVLARRPPSGALPADVVWREGPAAPEAYARGLYGSLRELDDLPAEVILVEAVPEDQPAWLAVADRLRRAATR